MRKIRLHAALLVLTLTLGLAGSAGAWSWHTYNGSQYSLTDTTEYWTAAEAEAVFAGGYLVTINNQAEQDHLVSQYGGLTLYWIGFTDQETESAWKWSSGQPVTHINWSVGEPNNAGDEDYAVMNWSTPGAWNDLSNGSNFSGIIEIGRAHV